jgi:hypothetical protein
MSDPENETKRQLATRLFSAYPPEMMLFGLVEAALGKNPTEAEVESLLRRLEEEDIGRELSTVCEDALMATFSEPELLFLAEFFDSEMGRTVVPRLGQFSATATPRVMRLLGRLISGVQ